MLFLTHFSVIGFSNSYLLGPEKGGEAVIIDPGVFDETILTFIEDNNLYLKYILVTHAHESHISGINTILKIYDAKIYGFNDNYLDNAAQIVCQGDNFQCGDFAFNVIETPGHSRDSVVYQLDQLLFTGDTISAGLIGSCANAYARGNLLSSIKNKILPLGDDIIILPGHGPLTKIGIEKKFNPFLKEKL
jgi:hydroxyacylglutathione hydrolase